MNFRAIPERLLTWLDVERAFKRATALWSAFPPGIHAVRCYRDGAEIEHSNALTDVHGWLKTVFGRAWQAEQEGIILRGVAASIYPISFTAIDAGMAEPASNTPPYPLWREVAYLRDLTDDLPSEGREGSSPAFRMPSPWREGPHMASFHSFKGGVGRTTALITYALARLQMDLRSGKSLRVLVVDADLEAPGVSLWLDDTNRPEVSYLQFLEAMHYPPESVDSSLDYFAQALRKTSVNVGGNPLRELFVLPAALSLDDIQDMPVQPGHLARNPSNPWILTDHLYALGRRLGVDVVLIDLRAGLSEFSSSVLFDPRVDHFFVTTVARQAVEGTATVLERLHAFNSRLPAARRGDAKPSLVLSLLNDDLRKLPDYAYAVDRLNTAYPVAEDQSSGLEWLEADFSASLMSISALGQALDVLKTSLRLFKHAQDWASALDQTVPVENHAPMQTIATMPREKARRLEEVCRTMQFAETSKATDMLITEPLRKLGRHFVGELPHLVAVGAKGAGKTFTFLQLCRAGSWHGFLSKVDAQPDGVANAGVFPVLWSGQFVHTTQQQIVQQQESCLEKLGRKAKPLSATAIGRDIDQARQTPPAHWDDFWDDLIAKHFGLNSGQGSLEKLNQWLNDHHQSVVLVFDGVEEAFPDPMTEFSKAAIESLLKLPDRLLDLPSRSIGAVVFVRADYVQVAVQQNVAQFLARYSPFALQWSPDSFLRLAYWLAGLAQIVASDPPADLLGQEALLAQLNGLWGRKMGSEQSKEALSARWVFASLCDLKGHVQARDLVRFLRFAAELEKDRASHTWQDRVLAPESMRKAVPKCSQDKVEEAVREIEPLKSWQEVLLNCPTREMPFAAKDVGLADKPYLLATLQELGVIYEDPQVSLGTPHRFYLPEIYRAGLGFKPSAAGRTRTLSLLKSNAGLPF